MLASFTLGLDCAGDVLIAWEGRFARGSLIPLHAFHEDAKPGDLSLQFPHPLAKLLCDYLDMWRCTMTHRASTFSKTAVPRPSTGVVPVPEISLRNDAQATLPRTVGSTLVCA